MTGKTLEMISHIDLWYGSFRIDWNFFFYSNWHL